MRIIKLLFIQFFLILSCNIFAQTNNVLLVKAHHPNDIKTIIRIWVTQDNDYIIRTSYSNKKDDFDQDRLMQFQKKVEFDGFAKIVTFTPSDRSFYIVSHSDGVYSLQYGFFSEALNKTLSIEYKIDYLDKRAFNNL